MLSVLLWPFLVLDPFICTATQVHVLDTRVQRHTITMNRKVHIPHALSSRIPPLHSQISSTTTASPLKLSSSLCQCLLKIHCNSLSPLSPSLLLTEVCLFLHKAFLLLISKPFHFLPFLRGVN